MRASFGLVTALVVVSAHLALAAEVKLLVNGKEVVSQPGIVEEAGVTYGPLRAVAEAVGGTVEWREQQQQEAVVCQGTRCVRFKASEGLLREGRLLIPLRKLGESLGGQVRWVDSPPQVEITLPTG